jgi:hypothetical protein
MDNWTAAIHMLRDGFLFRVSSMLDDDSDILEDQPLPLVIRVDALGPSERCSLIYDNVLAESYVGGCYYEGVHEFIALSGLYEDMLEEVVREARKAERRLSRPYRVTVVHEGTGVSESIIVGALSQELAEEKARTEWPYARLGWQVKRSTTDDRSAA